MRCRQDCCREDAYLCQYALGHLPKLHTSLENSKDQIHITTTPIAHRIMQSMNERVAQVGKAD
jgi:hypothetical protein